MTVHFQNSPVRAYLEASEAKDIDAIMATLSPGVVFHSPLSDTAAFEGRERVRWLFTAVMGVLSDLRYESDLGDERTRMLSGTARVGDRPIEEAARLRLDDQ